MKRAPRRATEALPLFRASPAGPSCSLSSHTSGLPSCARRLCVLPFGHGLGRRADRSYGKTDGELSALFHAFYQALAAKKPFTRDWGDAVISVNNILTEQKRRTDAPAPRLKPHASNAALNALTRLDAGDFASRVSDTVLFSGEQPGLHLSSKRRQRQSILFSYRRSLLPETPGLVADVP